MDLLNRTTLLRFENLMLLKNREVSTIPLVAVTSGKEYLTVLAWQSILTVNCKNPSTFGAVE